MEQLLRIGIISSPHGIRGEVKVFPTTDDVQRFKELKQVLLATESDLESGENKEEIQAEQKKGIELEIEGVKFFKQFVILKFKGIDDRNQVESYRGKDLLITRDQAVALEEGEYFIADLIGMEVRSDQGEVLGILSDVLQTGANDVYMVKREGKKDLLIPAIKQCILRTDLAENCMIVHLLDGLLDL